MTSQYGIESSRFDAKKKGKKRGETSERTIGRGAGRCRLFVYLFSLFYFFPLRRFTFQGARTKREQWRKRVEGEGEWKWAERGRVELSIASIHPSNDRAHAL